MAKKSKSNKLYPDQIPDTITVMEINVGEILGIDTKEIYSKKIFFEGREYWMAEHYQTGIYFTDNPRDPKILNTAIQPPKCRGNLKWDTSGEGGNPDGKPSGVKNKITVKQACEKLNANPAEFLAAVMKGDQGELRRYRVKDPKNITIAQKIICARTLLDKMVPNLKPVDTDQDGNILGSTGEKQIEDNKPQIQVYVPQSAPVVQIEATAEEVDEINNSGLDQFMEDHNSEIQEKPLEKEIQEGDNLAWEVQ